MALVIKKAGFDQYLDPNGGAYIKAIILGKVGVGKTPFAAQWPKPIIADCEHGIMSVASMGTPFAEIKTSADIDALLTHLERDKRPFAQREYQTFVVDTIDRLQKIFISERLKMTRKESLSGWADWGWLDGKMQQLIERLTNLPMHVLINQHVKDANDTDESGAEIKIKIGSLKGDSRESIFEAIDLIGLMETGYKAVGGQRELVRNIRWQSEPKYPMLRDRSNRLPKITEVNFQPSDFQTIWDAITKDVDQMPATENITTLETDDPAPLADPNAKGGPVGNPEVARPKANTPEDRAAKAEKKAAAAPQTPPAEQKASPSSPEPEPEAQAPQEPESTLEETPVGGGEAGSSPAADAPAPVAQTEADQPAADPEQLLKDKLGAEVIDEEPVETDVKTATPEPAAAAAPAAGPVCGDPMPGQTPKVEGCGTQLSKENGSRVQISRLKFKTSLCDDCYAKATA